MRSDDVTRLRKRDKQDKENPAIEKLKPKPKRKYNRARCALAPEAVPIFSLAAVEDSSDSEDDEPGLDPATQFEVDQCIQDYAEFERAELLDVPPVVAPPERSEVDDTVREIVVDILVVPPTVKGPRARGGGAWRDYRCQPVGQALLACHEHAPRAGGPRRTPDTGL